MSLRRGVGVNREVGSGCGGGGGVFGGGGGGGMGGGVTEEELRQCW